jgi:PAS domain S-box-containing protein
MVETWMPSKSEIPLSNEDLVTLDAELQNRIAELHQSNSDLANLLSSVELPIVMVGPDLRIRRFTQMAEKTLHLVRNDVGRHISDVKLNIAVPDLEQLIARVIHTASAKEQDVQCRQGRWYSLRIRPYRTQENKIDGAVLVLVDVDNLKLAEKAWRQSEPRFALFMRHLPGLAWIKDLHGRYMYANDAAQKVFRTPTPALYGKTDYQIFPLPTAIQFRENDRRALASEMGIQTIETLELEDGAVHHSLVSKFPILGPAGKPVMVGGIAIDITDRQRAETAMRESEKRLAAALAGMTRLQEISKLVQASDVGGLLLEIVDAAIAVTGADMGNIQLLDSVSGVLKIVANRGFERPFLDFFNAVHPGQAAACGTAMLTGKRVIIEDVSASPLFLGTAALEAMRAAGAMAVQSTPLVSRSGRLVGMLSTHYRTPRRPMDRDLHLVDLLARQAADCIERTQAEEMLVASEARFRLVVEAAPNAMIMVGRDGKIALVNKQVETLFGYAREELLGKPIEILVPERFRARHPIYPDSFFQVPSARPTGASRDLFGLRKDGSEVPIEIGLNPIQTPEGLATLASIIDITERKRLEEHLHQRVDELAKADRNKNEFLAILAHELRGPMAPIRNGLHILRQPNVDGSTIERVQSLMDRQIRNLTRLVDDLLDMSRITRGTIRLQKETIDLAAVVGRAVDSVRPLIERERHKLVISLPPEPVQLEADPTRLEQVLINLLHNAAKFTEAGGHLWLTVQRDNAEVVISVRDTGIGIASELLPRIFEMFTQEDRALRRSQDGLGIGLTLVRRLVELHDGTARAHSAGPGKGSEFVVRLPAVPLQRLELADPPREQEQVKAKALRILVVEDELAVAEMLELLLDLWGHTVQVVHNGPAALAAAPSWRPQVVLCDIGLPGMDGYHLARQLRQQQGLNRFVLIAITGYGQEEDQRRSHDAGFDHHLTKPVDPVTFEKLLTSLVDAR